MDKIKVHNMNDVRSEVVMQTCNVENMGWFSGKDSAEIMSYGITRDFGVLASQLESAASLS